MTTIRKLALIGVISLAIAILSQVYLESPLVDNIGRDESYGAIALAVHVTFVVTIPAFAVSLATLISALILYVRHKIKPSK